MKLINTKMILIITVIVLLVFSFFIFVTKFNNQSTYRAGGPYYYKSWASYFKPYRPVDEITIGEALDLGKNGFAYYEAYFNKDGLIIKFIKHYKDEVLFEEDYIYENGKLKNTITKKRGNSGSEN